MKRKVLAVAGAVLGVAVIAAIRWGYHMFTSPPPVMVDGQSIESRPPEKPDDKPAFPGQTRAPYHATKPPAVTTLTDKLRSPWSFAFLPDGKILITEKPGTMRVLDKSGTLSEPVRNVPAVSATGQVGLLDLALDPAFATNHRIFFTYSEAVSDPCALPFPIASIASRAVT
jgi:glucose/arabinose dehydrogenase